MLNKSTILELQKILLEEYNFEISYKDAEKFANSLVNYFDLLARIETRSKFGNHSKGVMDNYHERDDN